MSEIKNFGLLPEERRPTDWIHGQEELLGGSTWVKIRPIQIIDGDQVVTHEEDAPEHEEQRKSFETNACVSFAYNNCYEYQGNYEMKRNEEFKRAMEAAGLVKNGKLDVSDRRTAKGSGTDPERGNYVSKVDDYGRNYLFCPEDLYPFTGTMSREEYYQDMPTDIVTYGEKVKSSVKVETKYVSSGTVANPDQLWDAIQYSPIWASVDGFDQRNSENIIEGFSGYTHRITIRKGVYGKYWEIHDHYLAQFKKYAWNYPFGNCKIMQINPTKKKPMFQLIKEDGSPAVYLFIAASGNYYGIEDSDELAGGDLLKTFSGTYGNAAITRVPAGSIDTTKVVGGIAARKKTLLSTIFN